MMSEAMRKNQSSMLLVGFDSAWTPKNRGAIVGVVRKEDGALLELGHPQIANFTEAAAVITDWNTREHPATTIVLLDQPTIVMNAVGQRHVENIVASPVSLRYSGMQPANTSRSEMFGKDAPVWQFLNRFGGTADPLGPSVDTQVFETYPVLTMIALGWLQPDSRVTGRLPKYNPQRRKTFSLHDWRYVCDRLTEELSTRHLSGLCEWIGEKKAKRSPRKADQDCLDACICLLVALYLVESRNCLMVGNTDTGYIVVPHGDSLYQELSERCKQSDRDPAVWVRLFTLNVEK